MAGSDARLEKSRFLTDDENQELSDLIGRSFLPEPSGEDGHRLMELIEKDVRASAEANLTETEFREFYVLRKRLTGGGLDDEEVGRYADLMQKACPIGEGGQDFLSRQADQAVNLHQRLLKAVILFMGILLLYLWYAG